MPGRANRFLYLAALERHVASAPRFPELVLAAADVSRRGEAAAPDDLATMFADMLQRLETDALGAEWACRSEESVRPLYGPEKSVTAAVLWQILLFCAAPAGSQQRRPRSGEEPAGVGGGFQPPQAGLHLSHCRSFA